MPVYRTVREPEPGTKGSVLRELLLAYPNRHSAFYADLLQDDVHQVSAVLCAMRARGQALSERVPGVPKAPNSHPMVWRYVLTGMEAAVRPLEEHDIKNLRQIYWTKRSVGRLLDGKDDDRPKMEGASRTLLMDFRALRSRVKEIEAELDEARRVRKQLAWQVECIEEAFPKIREQRLRRESQDGRRKAG